MVNFIYFSFWKSGEDFHLPGKLQQLRLRQLGLQA